MISTHVLDLMAGKPAAGVSVTMARLDSEGWRVLARASTNKDGRIKSVTERKLPPGLYELVFETGAYFKKRKVKCFHPWVTVTIEVRNTKDHFHVPLLISPYGYSTYRGS